MEQEEHEVYGADIPDEVEMDEQEEEQQHDDPPNHPNKVSSTDSVRLISFQSI